MIKPKVALVKGSKKLINAWAFYDWANSVYPLVISSAIFPIYYGMVFSENNQIDQEGQRATGAEAKHHQAPDSIVACHPAPERYR